ncbi:hypothetical protein CVO74_09695 [Xanthomonas prunicola]|uniref:Uncharacterized protein n=1 Tax=Xanthomonas prunicola TaxID=2053930 RepID=A0A2N3RKW8_9XANT|nr:hypothetical protein XpruCFBP8353_07645 [Xanthomonas prunicola]PKV17405.1 hypothetical protein XpruCFBP8354_07640 [Xanthomonas prunicola]PKV21301.1 hypothetical protein CVO74_09695 [Xanthomonas prunicola]
MIGRVAGTRLAGTAPTICQHIDPRAPLRLESDMCTAPPVRSDVPFPIPDSRFPNPGLPA